MSRGRPLRVALDVTQIDNQTLGSGQFRYAVDLVDGLCAPNSGVHLTVFGSSPRPVAEFAAALESDSTRCRYVALPKAEGAGYYYRDLARLTWHLTTSRFDVFHQTHTNIPPAVPCPVVATVYHYYFDPQLFATRPYRYYCWALAHRARLVLPISDATRHDFHRELGVPLDRMRTVYLGLSKTLAPASHASRQRPFLLSPYNLSPTKNLRSLILAWADIAERHPEMELLLYGGGGTPENESAFAELLARTRHANRIRCLGHVSDAALAELYDACTLFVFPTTVEGFGYPLVEAMAHGACCITRDASAMKEIGGDAVALVETLRPEEITAAALAMIENPSRRAELGEKAKRRAAQFTTEAMVRQTIESYAVAAGFAVRDN